MSGTKLATAALVAAALLTYDPPARAETSGATLVAIVTAEPSSSLTRRVRAELEGLGLDVIVLKPPDEGTPSRAPLEQAARSVGAVAAVRLIPSREGKVEVWVADRVTGKAVVRELDAPEGDTSDAAVAVGSVELLRASLMELHSGEPPHGDAPPTEKIQAIALPPRPRVPRLGLGAGAGAELGVRGLGPSADIDAGLWIRIASHLGARLVAHASLAPAHVQTPSGAVDVRSQLFAAMAAWDVLDPSGTWVPTLSLGIAAAHVATTGTAVSPFVSATDARWYPAPVAAIGLAWGFVPGLRLRADGLAALTLPPAHVTTPTTAVGWWGGPAIVVTLGVEVLWSP
jgi:hypothetical protein